MRIKTSGCKRKRERRVWVEKGGVEGRGKCRRGREKMPNVFCIVFATSGKARLHLLVIRAAVSFKGRNLWSLRRKLCTRLVSAECLW